MTREYGDEQIRYIINQVEEEQAFKDQNIYEGVTVNDRQYEFKEVEFFEGSLRMHIPISFADMPDELVKLKYPSSDRPKIIRTDTNGAIDISFSLIPNNIDDARIPEVKAGMKAIFQKLNPSYLFFAEGIEIVDGKTIGFFLSLKPPTLTEPLFNVMFFMEHARNIIMGSFNCPYDEYLSWQLIVRQMLQSIRVGKKAEQSPEPPSEKPAILGPVRRPRGGSR